MPNAPDLTRCSYDKCAATPTVVVNARVYCPQHELHGRRHAELWNATKTEPKEPNTVGIKKHEGNKYVRTIHSCVVPGDTVEVDVYAVLLAFNVTDPAAAHAAKKVLCAGIRGKGSAVDDYRGAIAALNRAIEIKQQKGDA